MSTLKRVCRSACLLMISLMATVGIVDGQTPQAKFDEYMTALYSVREVQRLCAGGVRQEARHYRAPSFLAGPDVQFIFLKDESGRVTGMILRAGVQEYKGAKIKWAKLAPGFAH